MPWKQPKTYIVRKVKTLLIKEQMVKEISFNSQEPQRQTKIM